MEGRKDRAFPTGWGRLSEGCLPSFYFFPGREETAGAVEGSTMQRLGSELLFRGEEETECLEEHFSEFV